MAREIVYDFEEFKRKAVEVWSQEVLRNRYTPHWDVIKEYPYVIHTEKGESKLTHVFRLTLRLTGIKKDGSVIEFRISDELDLFRMHEQWVDLKDRNPYQVEHEIIRRFVKARFEEPYCIPIGATPGYWE